MHLTTFLPLLTLLTPSLALTTRSPIDPVPSPWNVTHYTEGCSPAACVYTFNISLSNSGTNEPSFSTTCTGNNLTPDFQACEDPAIATREVNGWSNVTLIVQHVYMDGEARFTVTGNHTIVNPGYQAYDFVVVQSEISAVA
ncbi:hypothetical protein GLAREA_00072 [Glarea lozoyensis ATCC 20868]|uniref:Uncharacterized protein n=1 Tax=Glarea lozoyensis (strain ATCC 20868 / MF5171) TaxID=1116229 RepID=S3CVD0_GLAL2|nr:uncharacterized protein GLAREA_00072 [Glarea lozoyensis ATCC 20868]EPE28914.1 hypothetical protein GLAREA_00072 [Glarea lozoyensis ATCC 20868]